MLCDKNSNKDKRKVLQNDCPRQLYFMPQKGGHLRGSMHANVSGREAYVRIDVWQNSLGQQ